MPKKYKPHLDWKWKKYSRAHKTWKKGGLPNSKDTADVFYLMYKNAGGKRKRLK